MKKHASFFYVLTLFNYLIFAQDVYQSIRVYDPTSETMEVIGNLGVPLDHITGKPGVFVDLTVKDGEFKYPDLPLPVEDINTKIDGFTDRLGDLEGFL